MTLIKALDAPGTRARPRCDPLAQALVGSRCGACGTASWPARAICHVCGSPDVAQAPLGRGGQLQTRTTVWIARPGIPAPYTLCMAELDDGVRIFAHLREGDRPVEVGGRVRVVVSPDDAGNALPFWFEAE